MSILTGHEIERRMLTRDIVVKRWRSRNLEDLTPVVGINSLDLHMGEQLYVYERPWWQRLLGIPLDPKNMPPLKTVPKRRDGRWLLKPGRLYLGSTMEWTETRNLVPYIDGRSSLARLGVFCHVTAGRGDIGFKGEWTVEIVVVEPILLEPGGRYFQMTYHMPEGVIDREYGDGTTKHGRYQNSYGVQESKLHSGYRGDR